MKTLKLQRAYCRAVQLKIRRWPTRATSSSGLSVSTWQIASVRLRRQGDCVLFFLLSSLLYF